MNEVKSEYFCIQIDCKAVSGNLLACVEAIIGCARVHFVENSQLQNSHFNVLGNSQSHLLR